VVTSTGESRNSLLARLDGARLTAGGASSRVLNDQTAPQAGTGVPRGGRDRRRSSSEREFL